MLPGRQIGVAPGLSLVHILLQQTVLFLTTCSGQMRFFRLHGSVCGLHACGRGLLCRSVFFGSLVFSAAFFDGIA